MGSESMAADPKLELAKRRIELEESEETFEIIQKHWGSLILPFIAICGAAIVTIILVLGSAIFGGTFTTIFNTYLVLLGIIYITLIAYGLSEYYSYTQSTLVITSQRIIDVEQLNFISRRVQTIDMYEIQSCSGDVVPGPGTIFNYGNVHINTVGDKSITLHSLPSPEVISAQIMHYHHLVAHGGVESAHNPKAKKAEEDKTPQLEQIPKIADKVAEVANSQPDSSGSPPTPAKPTEAGQPPVEEVAKTIVATTSNGGKPAIQLMFQLTKPKIEELKKGLQVGQEPILHPIEGSENYSVELVVGPEQVDSLVKQLHDLGASHIATTAITVID